MCLFIYNKCFNFYLYKVYATYAKKECVDDLPIMYHLNIKQRMFKKEEINIKQHGPHMTSSSNHDLGYPNSHIKNKFSSKSWLYQMKYFNNFQQ